MLLTRIRLAKEVTLGLIKPTVTSSPYAVNRILRDISSNEINIINAKKVTFDRSEPLTLPSARFAPSTVVSAKL